MICSNLGFLILKQPADDEAKQEDQSEKGSQRDPGQNDGQQSEVESWHLERQVVPVGRADVAEQNEASQVLRENDNSVI